MLDLSEDCNAKSTLVQTQGCVGAYDKMPLASASCLFTMDTSSDIFIMHSFQVCDDCITVITCEVSIILCDGPKASMHHICVCKWLSYSQTQAKRSSCYTKSLFLIDCSHQMQGFVKQLPSEVIVFPESCSMSCMHGFSNVERLG